MKVCVLGAGVVGVATAYFLARDGHAVTVIEKNPAAGLETSFANGGQLSYSYVAPLAGPGVLSKLPGWLSSRDAPLRFVPQFDLHQWRWCLDFVRACSRSRSRTSTAELLPLSFLSRDLTRQLTTAEGLDYDWQQNGKLVVYRDPAAFVDAVALVDYQASLGCEQQALDEAQCLELEPTLEGLRGRIQGGIYTPSEDAGDCRRFCDGLARALAGRYGVQLLFNHTLQELRCEGRRIIAARTDQGEIEADAFVVALGLGSRRALLPLGVRLPLYPLKGYSLTLPVRDGDRAPVVSITDAHHKIVYARLGKELRIAGMVELAGENTDLSPRRLAALLAQARDSFPNAGDYDQAQPWVGLRPATPDSKPILDATPYANLWLNVGHGALGFTLACGSGRVVADLVAGRRPPIPIEGFRLGR
ncbi:MAG TPA: D-amino acid dehydrogenase [Candidatus Competibacteraceae bacterium]|nr:D-amino acid dehydrogenase [Candidatus Competibacteraceae bacterium]